MHAKDVPLFLASLPRELCHIAVGKDHKPHHRMIAGFVVMGTGIGIAKIGGHMPDTSVLHYGLDLVGYCIHAIGFAPYLEYWLEE